VVVTKPLVTVTGLKLRVALAVALCGGLSALSPPPPPPQPAIKAIVEITQRERVMRRQGASRFENKFMITFHARRLKMNKF
jgi:hypothetical protein